MKSWRFIAFALALAFALAVALSRAAGAAEPQAPSAAVADSRDYIVLAVDNPLRRMPLRAGSSLPSYGVSQSYVVSSEAATMLAALEHEHHLHAVAAWPIAALGWQCVVYGVPPGTERQAVIDELSRDRRVRLVQPLQDFSTLGSEGGSKASDGGTGAPVPYDDPYVDLQRGFVLTSAARAHRLSTGHNVTVAVVDTGADLHHPDLRGQVAVHQDVVGAGEGSAFEQDAHGTAVAGIIAAVPNNRQGIVGIAPDARLNIYRACWYAQAKAGPARCNSFTLAKALALVMESDARIVNLSLGGPSDPLLDALLRKLLEQQRIVIGALPTSGRREGFPAGVPGVIVVGNADLQSAAAGTLSAPGRDVLTPMPGGRYEFSNGSSIATAHVSGIAALLLALDPHLDAASMLELLSNAMPAGPGASVNAEAAVTALLQRVRMATNALSR